MAAPQRTHYDVLGIPRDADAAAVRSAWKLHVQAWHPDRFGDDAKPEAEAQTARINEAYSVLRDSSRRAAYDCRLAADELAARPDPEPTRRPAPSAFPVRPSAAPVGSPMAHAAPPAPQPETLGEHLAVASSDAWRMVRRHPRVFAAAATVWVLILGATMIMHAVSGPTLPAPAAADVSHSALVADKQQLEDLEQLAAQAQEEDRTADAELQKMMADDARRLAAENAAAARAARLDALRAQRARRAATKSGRTPAATAPGRHIVRVMPTTR